LGSYMAECGLAQVPWDSTGWRAVVEPRLSSIDKSGNGGSNGGSRSSGGGKTTDTFYFAPNGKKFRSRAEVARWHGCRGAPETKKSLAAELKRKASHEAAMARQEVAADAAAGANNNKGKGQGKGKKGKGPGKGKGGKQASSSEVGDNAPTSTQSSARKGEFGGQGEDDEDKDASNELSGAASFTPRMEDDGSEEAADLGPGDGSNQFSHPHHSLAGAATAGALMLARKAAGELRQLQNTRTKLEKALAKEKEKRETSTKYVKMK